MSNPNLNGWSRSTWGSGGWNTFGVVTSTGVSGTAAVNSVTASIPQTIIPSGVAGTSAIASTAVVIGAGTALTGLAATSAVGTVSAGQFVSVSIAGFELSAVLSNVTGWSRDTWNAGGWGTASPAVDVELITPVSVTGVAGTSAVSTSGMTVLGNTGALVTGVAGTSAVSTVVAFDTSTVVVSGLIGYGSINSVAGTGNIVVSLTNGLGASANLGTVHTFSQITPNQNPNWTEIAA